MPFPRFRAMYERKQEETRRAAQTDIPAEQVRNQLRAGPLGNLPPGGNTGQGYSPADHNHTAAGDGGSLTNPVLDGYAILQEIAAPSAPDANTLRLYAKDKSTVTELFYKNSDGTERDLSATGGMTDPTTTLGDLIVNDGSGVDRLGVGSDGQVLTADSGEALGVKWAAPSSSSAPAHAYYDHLAALLEPDAIEPLLFDTFSYVVGPSDTKYVLASVGTQLGGAGHWENRDPRRALPLRDVTLSGLYSISCAIVLDPSLPTYSDSWTTYHDRLLAIATLPTRYIPVPTSGARYPFLPGPYGAIITGITGYDVTWIILRCMTQTIGINLAHEINDIDPQRTGHGLLLAVNKTVVSGVETGVGSGGSGGVSFVLCPSSWSAIPDPLAPYDFRDDFMGASLDTTTVWTRAQSTAGNVDIDTLYQWCKVKGNSGWGGNGLHTQTGFARGAGGTVMVIDVFTPDDTAGGIMVGWNDGGGQSYTNMAHGINFGAGSFIIYEGGTSRGTVGGSHSASGIYRLRLTLTSTGCTYEIQGGVEYDPIGGASWTDITPGVTSSAVATLYPGATAYEGTNYISDVRVYS